MTSQLCRYLIIILFLIFQHGAVKGQTGLFIPSEQFSSGMINDLCQDNYGYIWIATDNGLNRYDGYRFVEYHHQANDTTTICSSNVVSVSCDRNGQLWVGTSKGLDRYDYESSSFVHYPFEKGVLPRVNKVIQLRDGSLVVAASGFHGLYHVDGQRVKEYDGGDREMLFVNSVFEDHKGRLWQCGFGDELTMKDESSIHRMVSTQGFVVDFTERDGEVLIVCLHGILIYRHGKLVEPDIDMSVLKNPDAVIRRVFTDQKGNTYIGTRGDGLYRLAAKSRKLERVEALAERMNLNTSKIWAIIEDRQHNIWVGCQSKGLLMLPVHRSQFATWHFDDQGIDIASTVTSVCEGNGGRVWCSVQGNGIYCFDTNGRIVAHPSVPSNTECIYRTRQGQYWIGTDKALYVYDPLTEHAEQMATFDCDKINAITDDGKGNLYISTFSKGFWTHHIQTKEFKHYNSHECGLSNNWVMAMMSDQEGKIWLATSAGVSCFDPEKGTFSQALLEGLLCFSLCQTREGDILVGTEQGLFRLKKQHEPQLVGLVDKTVSYVVEDNKGDIWCATSKGIWQYDNKKNQLVGHVAGNGLTAKEYLNCVGLKTHDGRVCFATNNGLTMFRPSDVTGSHNTLPQVKLTGFYVSGKTANVMSKEYKMSYLDNSIQMEFSLLDYNTPGNIIFEHRMNGGAWQQNQEGQNTLQLNHLQPGTYVVEVRALSAGVYSPVTAITIEVTPPWYRSPWAYLMYAIGIMALILFFGWMWRRRAMSRFEEAKMRFLINATHDIRSPLTLIMGAVKKLKVSHDASAVDTVDRNVQRLLLLVNQILDERRIDKNQMMLHCRETDMVNFISGICKLYQFTADQRQIQLSFIHDEHKTSAWIDRIQFDKVISNLLGNAFKYTSDGGEIQITLSEADTDIIIQVTDNGIGFKDEKLERLFERFYQGRNADETGTQGTGIGLNLSRAITLMHGGQIKATHHEGGGALFIVTLPKGRQHLKDEQIEADTSVEEPQKETAATPKANYHKYRILVVDDEREIANYIITEMGNRYRFEYALDGKEALKMLLTEHYDLVISDVMMPVMDGFTLLKYIKDNPTISQLPVIMLTSKSEAGYKIEGLKQGADAYIAKPFDMEELHVQIENLLDSMRRLKGKFSGAVSQEKRVDNIEVKGNDDMLMDRVMQVVNAHMSEPEFNVEMLAGEVGLSRAQLHRRIKDITGIASGKFLRNLRMEQAARLLREDKVNISQIAYSIGYADLAQFSAAFKSHFGQTPSEYAVSHR